MIYLTNSFINDQSQDGLVLSLDSWEIEGSVNKLIPLYLEKQGQLASEYHTTKPDYSSMNYDKYLYHFINKNHPILNL